MNFANMAEAKVIQLHEDPTLSDLIARSKGVRKNFIIVRDAETNAIIQTKENLVLQTGREFNLRKIFGIPYNSETLANLNERTICLFGIGSGGTPSADPFNPIAPTPTDANLNTKVAFRTVATGNALPAGDDTKYYGMETLGGNDSYYTKRFTGSPTLVVDPLNDECYVKLTLDIVKEDARGTIISELGLYSARLVGTNYLDPKIATRVSFQSEPLGAATNKALVIEYYVYA
jgi:hypothetical protein